MNAQTKHTPGPWVKDKYGQLRSPDNRTIDCYATGIAGLVTPTEEGIANARLIAAAPELLEALIRVRPFVEHEISKEYGVFGDDDLTAIDAAIAKAMTP